VIRLLAISGSLRGASTNGALLEAAARLVPPGVIIDSYDGIAGLPHFNPDLDVDPPPAAVSMWRGEIAISDGLIISSPEYARGVPGALKNALDWLVSATEPIGLPVLLVSASPGGAAHAHAQLSEVLRTMNLRLVDGGAHVFSRAQLDPRGELGDGGVLAALRAGLAELVALAAAGRPAM